MKYAVLYKNHLYTTTESSFEMRNCFALGKGAKYREQCACMSVFLLAYLKTIYPNFTKFSVNVTYGRGSVLVLRRSDMLLTSLYIIIILFAQ